MDPVPALDEPLKKTLGGTTAKVMAEHLDLHTVGDLLHHYPRRYAERGELTQLADIPLDEHATVVAQVADARVLRFNNGKGQRLEVTLTDGSGRLQLVFFGKSIYHHQKELLPGRRGMFSGKVGMFRNIRQLSHPAYEMLGKDSGADAVEAWANQLIPLYPACSQMESWKIAKTVDVVLASMEATDWQEIADPLPPALRRGRGLTGLPTRSARSTARARRRTSPRRGTVSSGTRRSSSRWRSPGAGSPTPSSRPSPAGPPPAACSTRSTPSCPSPSPTASRRSPRRSSTTWPPTTPCTASSRARSAAARPCRAARHARRRRRGRPGRDARAHRALAQQHHRSITEMMGELAEGGMLGGAEQGTKVVLLTGSMGVPARRQALLDLVTGEAGIVIGTHALIEDKVQFHDLGLVVVDEQHRFGVEQRDALRSKGKQPPHLLVMTATPIPRTVAMTVFGDLETSVLDQLPAGRSPIATHVVPAKDKPHFLARAWERVREEVENGHQAYVVCPRIGDGDDDPKAARAATKKQAEEDPEKRPPLAVLEIAEQIAAGPLKGLRVEVLHGRMQPDDKDAVMRRFSAGETDVLVATTVIEVGVNVPNATAMVIMDADRFGVSQLHQLRGRVGRGAAPGLCLLVSEAHEASPARARLSAVAATLDGFELSRIDLEQRREGDVLGQAQSGVRSSLRMLAVIEDEEVIVAAREEAVASSPTTPSSNGSPSCAPPSTLFSTRRGSSISTRADNGWSGIPSAHGPSTAHDPRTRHP